VSADGDDNIIGEPMIVDGLVAPFLLVAAADGAILADRSGPGR
jgi:hypothetical protein